MAEERKKLSVPDLAQRKRGESRHGVDPRLSTAVLAERAGIASPRRQPRHGQLRFATRCRYDRYDDRHAQAVPGARQLPIMSVTYGSYATPEPGDDALRREEGGETVNMHAEEKATSSGDHEAASR